METVVRVSHVSKHFGSVRAVDDLSFSVHRAQCFGFLGPNGAGKTTMMKMIYARVVRNPGHGGEIDIFGMDPNTDELGIKYISGVVPQENNLDEELNVVQNLLMYAAFYRLGRQKARRRIEELLDFMELTEKAGSRIRELSGGMKRRLVIARALINEPQLLILDEPTTGLDPQVRHLIWDKLRQLKRQGTTILLTTHYMEEAYQICDEILIMHEGKRIMQDGPASLLQANIEPFVLELMHENSVESIVDEVLLRRVRLDTSYEVTRFYAVNMEDLSAITDGLVGYRYHLRQSNLEDVFLKATGRTLNASQ